MGLEKGYRERMKVIVVDDEIPIRDEIRTMRLAEHGYEIIGEAANGRTALQLCRQLQPDIVITDITMPVMDGWAGADSDSAEDDAIDQICAPDLPSGFCLCQ